ncbi:hypothetical protein [Streptomyces sp. TLI_146]|uniref:hypothetical protein n=1 Tax=Streptomyces sp. TLI_146 TaxID=1938858 RepID=UPI000C70BD50|nr:hypothetical protein [Streptomyces sp. TLI_146]PKV87092.1 hypothetical protein BX283_4683 [Streptomyces sp. TLI_146]
MGSLRNPVGPLPSSIYWRRRAVALSLLALLAVVILWAVSSGGGGGSKGSSNDKGSHPAPSITPGPGSSGPAISTAPGGRDETPGGSGSSSAGSSSSSSGGGTGGSSGGVGNGGADGGGSGSGGGAGAVGGGSSDGGTARQVPAESTLPVCAPGQLKLTVRSLKNTYAPGEKPRVEISVENTTSSTCKADLGPKGAVLVVTDSGDSKVWASDDCPSGPGSVLFQVPGKGTVTHVVAWDRTRSAAHCATPPPGAPSPGTYLFEVQTPGLPVARAPFSLTKD